MILKILKYLLQTLSIHEDPQPSDTIATVDRLPSVLLHPHPNFLGLVLIHKLHSHLHFFIFRSSRPLLSKSLQGVIELHLLKRTCTLKSAALTSSTIMKYLEYTPFDRINVFLDNLNLGEHTIKGCIEAYSCKHTGTDKRLSLSLENEILNYLGNSPDVDSVDSSSPVNYLSSRSSRKTMIYLILTLYHMYPDYDFSAVKAHQFFTEETWQGFKQIFDSYMSDASKEWVETNEDDSLLDTLYKALDEVINLAECDIYSYDPNSDADPFTEKGALWSYNFLFYNRKLKRVVSFRFSCLSNLVTEGFPIDGIYYDDDGEIFDDMDM